MNPLRINPLRFRLIVTVWPLCFAAYLMASVWVGGDGAKVRMLSGWLFDLSSIAASVLLVVAAFWYRQMAVRTMAGLGVVFVSLLRAGWLLDPMFVPGQKALAGAIYALVSVSALGWVMAADFAVVSDEIQREQEDHDA